MFNVDNGVQSVVPVGGERLHKFTMTLQKYKAGKASLENRVVASENWWKMRNISEEAKREETTSSGFHAASGWLHNVLVSKHADAMDSYPEPNVLPRESGDRQEAQILSKILPCILEQNQFEKTYSDAIWQKVKTGTGCYKVIWDPGKLNGLGDIAIERVSLLNVFWEPGVTDIQKSRYFFHTELCDNDLLEQSYPQLKGKLKSDPITTTKFLYDDNVDTSGKSTVIEVYYHTQSGGNSILQYCKYIGETVLFSTENSSAPASDAGQPAQTGRPAQTGQPTQTMNQSQPMNPTNTMNTMNPSASGMEPAQGNTPYTMQSGKGWYDHGKYPFVFDSLFPVEGSPCGYGYVDLCRNPQTEIDLLKTAIVKNSMVGATPRYFIRKDGGVNRDQFMDLNNALVDTDGNLGDDFVKPIQYNPLATNYVDYLTTTIQELRETSGNTETSTGSTSSGVTAASAIAALQEASGKGSRDSTQASYRAYSEIISLCIELIRQFYDVPRQFRIVGQMGMEQFVNYSNAGIQPQQQGTDFGVDMGYRLPVFDIKISAQKQTSYTKMSQNELALQFFKIGFFSPQSADPALMCLDMMEFDGKDDIMQKVSKNGTLFQTLQLVENYAVNLAAKYGDQNSLMQLQQIIAKTGGQQGASVSNMSTTMPQGNALTGSMDGKEHSFVQKARDRSANASRPDSGKVTEEKK